MFDVHTALERRLADFPVVSPELLRARALLSRVDTKFAVHAARVEALLARLDGDYALLRVEAGALATYRSLYFDTPSLTLFHDHRRGRRLRHKVRIRHYPDRRLSYLEVKSKRNNTITDKHRMAIPYGEERLDAAMREFLRDHVADHAALLEPALRLEYRRISLVGVLDDERVTFDLALRVGVARRPLPGLDAITVIEVKQARFCVRSPVMRVLSSAGLRPGAMSKYVVAQALEQPDLRCNRLLPELRTLEQVAS